MKVGFAILTAVFLSVSTGYASSGNQKAHGASLFVDSGCIHCHAIHKVGGHKGPDLSSVGKRLSEDQIRRQIVEGSKVMPSFGETLDSTDLEDLLVYLGSCRDKKK